MTGRLAEAQNCTQGLKSSDTEIYGENNSRGSTMALNAAAVWIYWAFKLFRKQRGISCWRPSPYQTSRPSLLLVRSVRFAAFGEKGKRKKHPTIAWQIDWSQSQIGSKICDVNPGPTLMCHQNIVHSAWGHGFYPSPLRRDWRKLTPCPGFQHMHWCSKGCDTAN